MVNWRTVSLIFQREVRDQFRDRRTLFMIAVLPLLLYPALGLGMMQLTVLFREQPRTVVVLRADDLPAEPALLEHGHFAERWFRRASDPDSQAAAAAAAKLVVISDSPQAADRATTDEKRLLERAQAIRKILHAENAPPDENRDKVKKEVAQRAGELFGNSGLQAVVIIPPGFSRSLAEIREQLAQKQEGAGVSANYARPEVVFNKADEKSQITYSRVTSVLDKWETAILEDWLKLARIDQKITRPVMAKPVDVALAEQVAASVWSKLFPTLLIIMSVTGAFYPAIDLVAGEKERGTMETLLICPATRTEIVLGKFFTVMLFSCATALLNLVSMGLTGKHIAGMAQSGALATAHDLSFPPLSALTWIVLLLIPLSALFSALCLALATFARSSKEGQYYLTPLLMVTLGLTIFCLSPTVDLTPQYSVVPVVGAALLLKGLLLSPMHTGALYLYVGPVLITSFGYSALALSWAIDQFKREEVLFREGERFDLRLWLRHILSDKQPWPTFGQAVLCFVLIMLLQFFAIGSVRDHAGPGDGLDPARMMQLILVQQLAIIAGPPLLMSLILTTSVRNVFRIHWPGWKMLAAACLLPVLIHPLSVEALSHLQWFFGELPPEVARPLATMSDDKIPIWIVLLAAAAIPGICEELAFRGFILTGLARRGRLLLAVVLSSVAFGIMHMIPQQVFNASLVGLVIGCLAIRSNSLLPCLAFHLINNALGVCYGRYGKFLPESGWLSPGFAIVDGSLRYRWPTLVVCVGLAAPLLMWLFRPLFARPPQTVHQNEVVTIPRPGSGAGGLAAAQLELARHNK
jgi:sodium transport system permease protein